MPIHSRPLNARQLAALGRRIRAMGDMPIPVSHLLLARLMITAQVPFGFGSRMLDHGHDQVKREVDATALNALLLIAESKLPQDPPAPRWHDFKPSGRYGLYCAFCGYGRYEALKHNPAQI